MEVIDNCIVICKRARDELILSIFKVGLRFELSHKRIQIYVESCSSIRDDNIHYCLQLKSSHLQTGIFAGIPIHVGKSLIVKIMLLLRQLKAICNLQ